MANSDDFTQLKLTDDTLYIHARRRLQCNDDIYIEHNLGNIYLNKFKFKADEKVFTILNNIITGKVDFWFEETCFISLDKGDIHCLQRSRLLDNGYNQYVTQGIPNPLQYCYDDWNVYGIYIWKAAQKGELSKVIHEASEAISVLCVDDFAVINQFINELSLLQQGEAKYWNNNACIYLPDKCQSVTVKTYSNMLS